MNDKKDYNTWLLKVNIDNIESNYITLLKNVGFYLLDSDFALIEQLKHDFIYYDKIDFNNLNIKQVRQYLKDFKDEHR